MAMTRSVLALCTLLALAPAPARALWKTLSSDSFTVFYPAGREREALSALEGLEAQKPFAEALVGRKGRRLAVVLEDMGTESNGYTDSAFRNLHLYLCPSTDGELAYGPDWWGQIGIHEYVHWLHLTSAAGVPGALRWAFGDGWAPFQSGPAWLAEGLAVYAESAWRPESGRLNEGLFDAYLEVRLRAGRPPTLAEATFQPPSFPGGRTPYLFGGEFVDYLARAYGREAVTDFLQRGSRSLLTYLTPVLPLAGLDRAARQAFGQRTPALWREWLERSRGAEPAAAAVPAGKPVRWLGRPVVHEGVVYTLCSQPKPAAPFRQSWRHELRTLDPRSGRERVLARLSSAPTGGLRLRHGKLYFTVGDLRAGLPNVGNLRYGLRSALYELDPVTRRRVRLFRDAVCAFEPLPGGGVVYSRHRTDGFGSEILLWEPRPKGRRDNPRLLLRSEYQVREILAEEDGVFVSARRSDENFRLYRVEPDSLALSPVPTGLTGVSGLSRAEGRLLLTAVEGGRSAVYAGDRREQSWTRLTEAPYAAASAFADGELWYAGLHPDGFALYRIPLDLAVLAAPASSGTGLADESLAGEESAGIVGSPAPLEGPRLDPAGLRAGGYGANLLTLAPRLLAPLLSVDPARGSYYAGLALMGRSALGDIEYSVGGLLDLSDGSPALQSSLLLVTAPFSWALALTTLGGGELAAAVEVPLFRRLEPLARYLYLGLAGYLYGEELEGRQLEPYARLGLGGALDRFELYLSLPLERVELGSAENRAGVGAGMALEHAFGIGALRLELEGFQTLDGSAWRLPPLRGNADGLSGETGLEANLDFPIQLLQIRTGLWNPPLFLQDVYVVPFGGLALNGDLERQWVAGLELHWELKALAAYSGLPLDLSVGMAVNGEGRFSLSFGLSPFGWAGLQDGPRRRE